MNTYHPDAAGSNEPAMVLVTSCLVLLLCWLFFSDFVRWSCWALYWLWRLADFPHIHRYAAERINLLATTGNGAESVGLSQWRDVMNLTAGTLDDFRRRALRTAGRAELAGGARGLFKRRWP